MVSLKCKLTGKVYSGFYRAAAPFAGCREGFTYWDPEAGRWVSGYLDDFEPV